MAGPGDVSCLCARTQSRSESLWIRPDILQASPLSPIQPGAVTRCLTVGPAWAPRAPCPSAHPPLHTHPCTRTHSPPCTSTRPHAHSQTCTQSTSQSGTHTGSRAHTRTHTHGHRSLTHTVLSEASLGDCGFAQKLPTMDYSCFVGVCLLGEGSRSQEETAAGFRGFGWTKCLPLKGPHTPHHCPE